MLGSTGAPLPSQSYHWVRDHVGPRVQVASTSGGTDIVSGFAGSAPNTAVWPGEISAPMLGVALDAFDSHGRPVTGEVGELVVTRPMPSMPIHFWNDPDGTRYHQAYFTSYPGVWRHGDWMTRTPHGSVIISGRSDSTLNRHGVRLGSADIYAVVDELPGIRESLVIGAELRDGDYWMPLFVVPAPGHELDDDLRDTIRAAIRTHASPRHVPDTIIEVPALPHTRTGKKLEVPVKRLLQGAAIDQVAGREAVDDISALEYFTRFARLSTDAGHCTHHADGRPPIDTGPARPARHVTQGRTPRTELTPSQERRHRRPRPHSPARLPPAVRPPWPLDRGFPTARPSASSMT